MADINDVSGKLRELEKEMNRLRKEAADEADRIAQESRRKYQELKSECEQQLAVDREATGLRYQELLNNAVADIRSDAEEKLRAAEQQYKMLKMRLDAENRRQIEETQRLKNIQMDLQKKYETMIDSARALAETQIGKAKSLLSDFDLNEPYRWFPPNNKDLFYSHLETAVQCFENGIYQAAAGIADSLILSLEIECSRIDHLLDKWIKNYLAMKTVTNSEKKLLLEESRSISWMSEELQSEWGLTDFLPDEIIAEWINAEYFNYVKAFENTAADTVLEFDIPDVTDDSKKKLKKLMHDTPYTGSSAENMYSMSSAVSVRLAYESRFLCAMRSRIRCLDDRCTIKVRLDELLDEMDFTNVINRFQNDDQREKLILSYENKYREGLYVYLFVIPVFSEIENKWYNNIGYSFDISDHRTRSEISERLNDEFINLYSLKEETGSGLTIEQIAGRLEQRFRSAINGHS